MSENPNNYPPYTPIASLGRELGIMFAFIGACLVTMLLYSFAWRAHQTRTKTADLTRRKAFQNRASITNPHYIAARTAVTSLNSNTTSNTGAAAAPVFRIGGETVVADTYGNGFVTGAPPVLHRVTLTRAEAEAEAGDGNGNGNGLVELPVHGLGYGGRERSGSGSGTGRDLL